MDSESLKKLFQECSLKARALKVILPSGFEFEYLLPTIGRFLEFSKSERTLEDLAKLIQEGMPEGIDINDMSIDDFNYLNGVFGNFFKAKQTKNSPNGLSDTPENS